MASDIFTRPTGFMCAARRCALAFLTTMSVVTWAVPAQAQIARSWNAGPGSWFVGTNWSPIGVPGPLDGAFIGNLPGIETDQVSINAGDTVAAVSIQSGMRLSVTNGALTVNGATTVSGNGEDEFGFTIASTLALGGAPGAIAYVTNDLTISDGARAILFDGVVLRVLGTFAIDETSDLRTGNGGGVVNLLESSGTALVNDGSIDPRASPDGLTINQLGGGLIDLDGQFGNGVVLGNQVSTQRGSITINGTQLVDSFSGTLILGEGQIANMNLSNGWTADNNSRISVSGGIASPGELNGGDVNLGGEISIGGINGGSLLVNADATFLSTANVTASTGGSKLQLAGTTAVNGGTFHLNSGTNLFFSGTTTVSGGIFTIEGVGTVHFDGPTTLTGGTFNTENVSSNIGDVDFKGPTTYSGNITINGIAHQEGDATVSDASIISGISFDMDGPVGTTTWDINDALEVNVQRIDATDDRFDGTLDIGGPTAARLAINLTDLQASWEMAGTMNLGGVPIGFANRVAGSRMVVTGQLNVQQRVDISADTTLSAASTTDIDASAHVLRMSGNTVVEPGATITGDGHLQNASSGNISLPAGLSTGNVGLSNEGLLRLGDAVGVVAVAEFVQSAGATLMADVGRNTISTDSDVLTISSSMAFVDGFVQPNIVNIGGTFQPPQIGDAFTILTAVGGVSGTFDDVLDANLGGQIFEWTLIHNPNNVQIELASIGGLLGDYNQNGLVDAADYVIYRDTLGSLIHLAADGNQNGVIDKGDYDIWRSHFGQMAGSGTFVHTTVPEPATQAMLSLAAACVCFLRSRPPTTLRQLVNARLAPTIHPSFRLGKLIATR